MPTVLEWKGWKFLFYSLDYAEPPHVHVRKDRKEAKIWLCRVELARNRRCTDQELATLLRVTEENRTAFLEKWHEHFGS